MTPKTRFLAPHAPRRGRAVMFSLSSWLCLLLLGGGSLLTAGRPALAQQEPAPAGEAAAEDDDEETQAAKHFEAGRKLYEEEKFQEAIAELLKAYELRPAPPILLNIARTYEKLQDKTNALKFYKEFLLKARLQDPNRPNVEKMVKSLEGEVGGSTGAVTSASGTETPEVEGGEPEQQGVDDRIRVPQMIHTPVDSARFNTPVTLMAETPPDVTADFVVVNFRRGGEMKFRQLAMEQQGEAYVGQLPGKFLSSTSLQYYIQAVSTRKGIVAMSGNNRNPHIIVVEGGRPLPKGPVKEADISSPYYKWFWVAAGGAAAFLGGSLAFTLLSMDRGNALEEFEQKKSCTKACRDEIPKGQKMASPPRYAFDYETASGQRPLDWQKEGKTFNILSGVFLGMGVAALGTAGYLFYKDRKYVSEERERLQAASPRPAIRVTAAPWAGQDGAGFVGRVDF